MARLRAAAVVVFLFLPAFSILWPRLAGRVTWTVIIAGLPLFIVLAGYHRWRRICPLALLSQLPRKLGYGGTRKAGAWLERNYHYVAFTIFVSSLWIRLTATNGDGRALALFFALISLAAFASGAIFTGKTWCNHFCPVSFVEKIYTEPHGLRATQNSQCDKCTACKKYCPDISEENGFWKELLSTPKRIVYFSFPGTVFGFYFYYYLQSGSWDYYFGGSWTDQPGVFSWAFLPGHDAVTAGFYFLPQAPRALAALATLLVGAAASFLLFSGAEAWISRRSHTVETPASLGQVRHWTFAMASFLAFVTFYTFAGAPTLRKVPWAPHVFLILVVASATATIVRRLPRTQELFSEETLARNILKRWPWTDIPQPRNLHDAFLIHSIRSSESSRGYEQLLAIYKDALLETLTSGLVAREDVERLQALRNQMRIRQADHDKAMLSLSREHRLELGDPSKFMTAEKRLQLGTYKAALRKYLDREWMIQGAEGSHVLEVLRSEYNVGEDEHRQVLMELMGGADEIAERIADAIHSVEEINHTITELENAPSPVNSLLTGALRRQRENLVRQLLNGLHITQPSGAGVLESEMSHADLDPRRVAQQFILTGLPPHAVERLHSALDERDRAGREHSLEPRLRSLAFHADPYVRGLTLQALAERQAADPVILEALGNDDHPFVRRCAAVLKERAGDHGEAMTPVERIAALRSVPVFSNLEVAELEALERSGEEVRCCPGEELCREGEPGGDAFVLLTGSLVLMRGDLAGDMVQVAEGQGRAFGEMAILEPGPRDATVKAGPDGARVLRLNASDFCFAVESEPRLALSILRTMKNSLRAESVDRDRQALPGDSRSQTVPWNL